MVDALKDVVKTKRIRAEEVPRTSKPKGKNAEQSARLITCCLVLRDQKWLLKNFCPFLGERPEGAKVLFFENCTEEVKLSQRIHDKTKVL